MSRSDIDYDYEDFGMTESQVEQKYGATNEHPAYNRVTHAAYQAMPTRNVKLPYWAWVVSQIAKDDEALEGAPVPSNPADRLSEQQVEDLEMVPVESIDQFAGMVSHWHEAKVAQLRHFQAMPEGQTVIMQIGDDTTEIVLTGDAYNGFQAGILTALLQFGNLPFAMTATDDPDATKH